MRENDNFWPPAFYQGALLLLFGLFTLAANAQKNRLLFKNCSEGLPHHSVSSIKQDHFGFLWIGTRYGLHRYDGLGYASALAERRDTLQPAVRIINTTLVDQKGNLWVGTNGEGLQYFNNEHFQFATIPWVNQVFQHQVVEALYEDEAGHIWVGTARQGLYVINPQDSNITHFAPAVGPKGGLPSPHVTAITGDALGHIWVGTWDAGLLLFSAQDSSFAAWQGPQALHPASQNIRCLLQTSSGHLLAGTGNGLYSVQLLQGVPQQRPLVVPQQAHALQGVRILSLAEDKKGIWWAGTENEGLFRIHFRENQVQRFEHQAGDAYSLCSNSIWALHCDDRGTLWIGTFNQGMCKLDPYEFKFPPVIRNSTQNAGLESDVISSFSQSGNNDRLWVGTEGGGLHVYQPDSGFIKVYQHDSANPSSLSSNYVVCLTGDSAGRLWAGTWKGGLNQKRKGKSGFRRWLHEENNPQSIANNDIYALRTDRGGRVWISCFRAGVDIWLPQKDSLVHLSTQARPPYQIGSDLVRCFYEDAHGYMWLGTEGSGAFRIKISATGAITSSQQYAPENSNLSSSYITSLYEDQQGNMWIGTEGDGLFYSAYPYQDWQRIAQRDGLEGTVIYSIEQARDGALWMSTNNGLSRIDSHRVVQNFQPKPKGPSSFYRSSSLGTDSGHLLFGGIEGFYRFHPDDIPYNPHPPRVYFTGFGLQKTEESQSKSENWDQSNPSLLRHISLTSEQNDWQFSFAALNYSASAKNQYAYQLWPYDHQWRYTTEPRDIYYNNIPPGNYTLKIKAANNDGVWSRDHPALHIYIAPPWYRTGWAYGGYILFILSLLWLARWNIIRNERLKGKLALEHLQLEQAQELNRIRSKFFTYITHEFRTPLTLIIAPLRDMLSQKALASSQKNLKTMLNNAKRLLMLINQILDLSKLESGHLKLEAAAQDLNEFVKRLALAFTVYADEKLIRFEVEVSKEKLTVYFDAEKLEKVLLNLLSNAFKFTPAYGKITLSLQKNATEAIIRVEDSGKGIPKQEQAYIFQPYYQTEQGEQYQGTGIGLTLAKELIELHGGTIAIVPAKESGTCFEVRLPLGSSHLQKHEITNKKEPFTDTLLDPMDEVHFESGNSTEDTIIPADAKQPILLLVEDNTELLSYLNNLFQKDYQTLCATNGKEALQLALDYIPDLVLSDIIMPGMDGQELCKALKQEPTTSHVPVVLLTAKSSKDSQLESFEKGAVFFITKPFDPKILRLRIENILDDRRRFQQQILKNKGVQLEPDTVDMPSPDQQFLEKVMQVVQVNMGNPNFHVSDLSEALHMSKPQLYRKMKGLVGCSANEFIRTLRLKKAAMLLRKGHYSVAETTYQVGFNDLQYFRKCFVKQYGVTPSEYATQTRSREG